MMAYRFKLNFKVRDYECDIQGIVNNSVYQNYLEHTRHEFLCESGINFAELASNKINLVVVRAEMDYKYPLKSGDEFWVGLNLEKPSKIRFDFLQDIFLYPDDKPILTAKITGTSLNEKGRPFIPEQIEGLFTDRNLLEDND